MSPRESLLTDEPLERDDAQTDLAPTSAVAPAPSVVSGLLALQIVSVDVEARRAELRLGSAVVGARLDDALHPGVVETAIARGERLIAQREGDEWVVLGALRTAPTPGVDKGDDYVIEARRISLRGDHEVAVVAGASSVVLRALGHLELLSRNITARAEGVQKLFAKIIQLN